MWRVMIRDKFLNLAIQSKCSEEDVVLDQAWHYQNAGMLHRFTFCERICTWLAIHHVVST
jgi:hypothetical protein